VKHLGLTTSPDARATIVWLVGEYAGVEPDRNFAPDVLRVLVQNYADEPEPVKQQILLLGAKVYLHHILRNPPAEEKPPLQHEPQAEPNNEWADSPDAEANDINGTDEKQDVAEGDDAISLLWRYILLLARYDTSYDLRDRARLYKALLSSPSSTQIANLLLLAPKPVPHVPSPSETRKDLLIGSATLVLGPDAGAHGLRGYENLPDWVQAGQEPDPSLRESEVKVGKTGAVAPTAGEQLDRALKEHEMSVAASNKAQASRVKEAASASKSKTLDQWLDEREAESEDESEYEEVTDSEEEEGSTEYETDSEEEEDEEDDEEEDTDSDEHEQARQLLA
jgi:hypothetical protein